MTIDWQTVFVMFLLGGWFYHPTAMQNQTKRDMPIYILLAPELCTIIGVIYFFVRW